MIVTDGWNMVDASGTCDGKRPVEVHAAVKKGPRQGDGIGAHRRDDVGTRSQGLCHRGLPATKSYTKKNKVADDCCHFRAFWEHRQQAT